MDSNNLDKALRARTKIVQEARKDCMHHMNHQSHTPKPGQRLECELRRLSEEIAEAARRVERGSD